MTDPRDPAEPLPTLERTSVLAVDDLVAHDVRRALLTLSGVRAPSLAPLVRTEAVPGGAALTHLVPAAGVTLASLRADGPLRAGHALAVGVAVLEALVALHATGLAHGGVAAGTVLVAPDGSVVLGGCGLAWARAPGEPDGPRPTDDVEAVGELLRDLLGAGSAPAPLVVAVVRALDPDLALRPDAAGLLDALQRCGRPDPLLDALWAARPPHGADPAAAVPSAAASVKTRAPAARGAAGSPIPVRVVDDEGDECGDAEPSECEDGGAALGGAGGSRGAATSPSSLRFAAGRPPQGVRRARAVRRPRRAPNSQPRLFVALALLALGAVAGLVVVRYGGPGTAAAAAAVPAPAASASTSASASTLTSTPLTGGAGPRVDADWRDVLEGVDAGRTAALAAGSTVELQRFVTGTAYAVDGALARTVASSGARIEGGGLVLEDVRPVALDEGTVVLRVRDRRAPYAVVLADGRHEVPERASRSWTVTLVRAAGDDAWRISEVSDAGLSPGGRR